MWLCLCSCVWGWGAFALCVSNPSVFNEISHFLLFFILIPFLARTQGSRIHSHSFFLFPPFSLLRLSQIVTQPFRCGKRLSFSFKLAWPDLPCSEISACWTGWHAIQHQCNGLKLSRLPCQCLAVCTVQYITSRVIRILRAFCLERWHFSCFICIIHLHIHKCIEMTVACFSFGYMHFPLCIWSTCSVCLGVSVLLCTCHSLSIWVTDWQKAPGGWRHDNRSPFQCHSA